MSIFIFKLKLSVGVRRKISCAHPVPTTDYGKNRATGNYVEDHENALAHPFTPKKSPFDYSTDHRHSIT